MIAAGNPGMAVGGMGDLLTGIIAALRAQGLDAFDAASSGALLHGLAGDAAASDGQRGLLPTDLLVPLRRLVNPDFAALLVRKLAPTGRLHLATDWHDYAEQMWDVLDATPGISNRAGPRGSVPRPEWRPQTHFETRGQKLGHGVWDLAFERLAASR